ALDRFVAGNVLALGWHDRDEHHAGDLARRIESDVVDIPVIYASDGATIVDRMSEYLGKSKSSARRRQPAN
ncbi:MAG: hypothetical protein ABEL76_10160, partial [Bradymonadaceae bacterium]